MIAAFMVPRESICKSCEHKIVCAFKIIEERNACMTGCSRYEKEHKPTNADRIRSMTDEELAEEMGANIDRCPPSSTICPKGGCKDCWLGWLKQEVESNDS